MKLRDTKNPGGDAMTTGEHALEEAGKWTTMPCGSRIIGVYAASHVTWCKKCEAAVSKYAEVHGWYVSGNAPEAAYDE